MAKGDIKRRREIERLSASLPSMNAEQRKDATECCGTAWIGTKKGWCDVCAQEFDSESLWKGRKKHIVCPVCGARVDLKRSPNKRKNTQKYYFHIVTTAERWQVVRTFLCIRKARRVERFGMEILNHSDVEFDYTEVFQRFFKSETVPMIIGLGLRGLRYYSDEWKWDSGWKIRSDRYTAYDVWGWMARKQEILPELRKLGLKKLNESVSPYNQIQKVFNNYQAEVMLKAGAVKLFEKFVGRDDYKVRSHWESIRIVLRHGYHKRVRDWGMWFDMMDALKENGKDIRNPHYICPDDLRKAHDEQFAIRERRREKARLERERQEAIRMAEKLSDDGKTNIAYVEKMGKVLGVMVRSRDITLIPLQNIRDFFEEGSTLHHCVFRNKYYQHNDCLIIGARVNGRRTETIEIDTKEWKIVQCRGKHNQPSRYHTRIVKLMNQSMNKFKEAMAL